MGALHLEEPSLTQADLLAVGSQIGSGTGNCDSERNAAAFGSSQAVWLPPSSRDGGLAAACRRLTSS